MTLIDNTTLTYLFARTRFDANYSQNNHKTKYKMFN